MAEDFNIKITTTSDARGADQVAAALKGVGKAADDTGKQTRTLGDDLLTLGSRNNATKDVVEGLDAALKGNANSMFGVAKAAKNLFDIFTVSTPAGRALQLALIGVNTAITFLPGLLAKSGESAEDVATKFDAFRKSLDKFASSEAGRVSAGIAQVKEEASALAFQLDHIIASQEKIDKARGDDPTKARSREDLKLGLQYGAAIDAAAAANGRLGIVETVSGLEQSVAAHDSRLTQRTALVQALAQLPPMVTGPGAGTPQGIAINTQRSALARQISGFDADVSPERTAAVDGQRSLIEQLRPAAEAALKAAREAEETVRRLSLSVVGLRPDGSAIRDPSTMAARALEDRAARRAAGLPEAVDNGAGSFSTVTSAPGNDLRSGRISFGSAAGAEALAARIEENQRKGDEMILRALEARLRRAEEERARRLKAFSAQD